MYTLLPSMSHCHNWTLFFLGFHIIKTHPRITQHVMLMYKYCFSIYPMQVVWHGAPPQVVLLLAAIAHRSHWQSRGAYMGIESLGQAGPGDTAAQGPPRSHAPQAHPKFLKHPVLCCVFLVSYVHTILYIKTPGDTCMLCSLIHKNIPAVGSCHDANAGPTCSHSAR